VRWLAGQAARHTGRLLHVVATLAIALAVLAGGLLSVVAWRLSQGPLELPWLTQRVQSAASDAIAPARLTVAGVALNWEGFRLGVDRPLDLRLTGIAVTDGAQHIDIPRAEISLSLHELLLGRVRLRAAEVDAARIALVRAEDGTIRLDLSNPPDDQPPTPAADAAGVRLVDLLAELARPATTDRGVPRDSIFSQLQRLRIADASIVVTDRKLHTVWRAPQADIDLQRAASGGVAATAELTVKLGDQQARLTASGSLGTASEPTRLRLRLAPVAPAALARAVGALAPLSALEAEVSGDVALDLGSNLELQSARLTAQVGPGEAHIGTGSVPIRGAVLVAEGSPGAVALRTLQVRLQGHDGGPLSTLAAYGTLRRGGGQITADLTLDLDQVDFADLHRLWPEGTGGGARSWIVQNITAGTARDGHVMVSLATTEDFADVTLTRATGTLNGDELTVSWLRPVPPIEHGHAQLRIIDPDTLDIVVSSGQQAARNGPGGLLITDGKMRVTGIMQPHQVGAIDATIAGPLPDAIALLSEPRLHLLDRHPIELKDPSGQVNVGLTLTIPLEDKVRMDDIAVHAQAHLDDVHLGSVVAGRDLDHGVLDLDVTGDGMRLTGQADLATIPAKLDAMMDFRAGPPTQVLQRFTVSGHPDAAQLAAAGLSPGELLGGALSLQATLSEYRSGAGDLAVTSDLRDASLHITQLGWRKPVGAAAEAHLHALLQQDRLTAIDQARITGDGIALRGSADFAGGRPSLVHLDQLVLGATEARGTLRLPVGNAPYVADISGPRLDLSGLFAPHDKTPPRGKPPEPQRGAPWTLDAKFDHVILAQGHSATGVAAHAENDGLVFNRVRVEGRNGGTAPFDLEIAPDQNGRRLRANAADAGALLAAADLIDKMDGGRLVVTGNFDDRRDDHPLSGTATIEDFRMRNAPALARLLQAMTLYGLVELAQGPGLGFTRLIAPFRLTDDALELYDARAFSSSLGLTAKGRLDRLNDRIDLEGTIVPAYFFNSLLGNIPLVGRLLVPEQGGGLFAASYSVHGAIDDPQVAINPLSALTPGFLRSLFGKF
jgi:AsmA-like C-terminal region/Protein of unknown function